MDRRTSVMVDTVRAPKATVVLTISILTPLLCETLLGRRVRTQGFGTNAGAGAWKVVFRAWDTKYQGLPKYIPRAVSATEEQLEA